MTSRDFVYWLQGWFELNKTIYHRAGASKETMECIQNHLNMVFKHEIDPSVGSVLHQQDLSATHEQGSLAIDSSGLPRLTGSSIVANC